MDVISIIDYQPDHQEKFERFNRNWIEVKALRGKTAILYSSMVLPGAIHLF